MDIAHLNATVPSERSETVAVVYGTELIVFGGVSNTDSATPILYNDLWSYDLASRIWTQITPNSPNLPPVRSSHSAGILTDGIGSSYLLVFSGRHFNGTDWSLLKDLWLFSFDESVWIPLEMSLSVGRVFTTLIITPSLEFWYFGGCDTVTNDGRCYGVSYGLNEGAVDICAPSSSSTSLSIATHVDMYGKMWDPTHIVVPPVSQFNHKAVLWENMMLVHGGSLDNATQTGDMWQFSTSSADMGLFEPDSPVPATDNVLLSMGIIGGVFGALFVLGFVFVLCTDDATVTDVSIVILCGAFAAITLVWLTHSLRQALIMGAFCDLFVIGVVPYLLFQGMRILYSNCFRSTAAPVTRIIPVVDALPTPQRLSVSRIIPVVDAPTPPDTCSICLVNDGGFVPFHDIYARY